MATEKISSTEPSSNQYAELAVEEKGERLEEGITTATTEVGHADSDYKATRARNAVLFASALMVSVFVILNLPYQYVERYATGGVAIDVDFQNQMSALPIMAGMPFRYSIRYAGDHPIEAFSWSALMLNLVSLVASIAVVGVYLYRKKIKQKRSGRASLTISDLLVATFLTAVGIGGYQYLEMEQTKLLKYQSSMAAQGHGIAISAWLPKVIADCIPQAYARLCCSVRGVRLESPSDAVLNETLRADNLTSFRIGGDGYDLRLLDQLSGRIHLDDLRIAGRSIDQGTVRVIGALPRLETLNLIRSNVPAVAISSLELPKLRRLDLRMTDLTLAELGTPPWSKNVVELSLPRPYDRSDKIEIENWPELRRLTVNDLELQVNSRLLEIKLANLPKLEELKLDQLQCYALQLTQLPVLPEITLLKDNIANRLARGEKYPSTLWVRRFEIDQLPKLASISFYVSEVEQIRLSRLPELKGAYVDVSRYDSSGYRHSNAISQRSKVVLVDGLAASDGPEIIDFNGVDLSGVELAPLRANSRLAELRLVGTGIGLEQLTKLSPMPQLMKLQVDSSVFTPAKLGRLLDAFPSIESLQFEDSQDAAFVFRQSTEDLHLSDHPNLKTLLAESLSQGVFRSVQIRNMPSLNSAFDFAWVENDVHIQGAPNLRGLSFAAPLPATVQLSDLQNLEYFAAGGDRVDDSIVEAISHSERLATLTLAYASASSESLKSIPVASLKHLCLAGCNVDDEVVRAWGDLTQLESLDLSQTQITGVSLDTC
ncbi:hypothetical protein [Rhodopirellula sp. MGV]|uniref:hypothetical protein n=1 Tax=Rhodopirellula sp. MGV TaxID=2023130 RepID=UPI000BD7E0E8|nr:hypothetical protein [Rhodopirellula sp. MGV]OYP31055.1 hypothetical protein CGZ80_22055 [Rhodopirellula sp. MGV]